MRDRKNSTRTQIVFVVPMKGSGMLMVLAMAMAMMMAGTQSHFHQIGSLNSLETSSLSTILSVIGLVFHPPPHTHTYTDTNTHKTHYNTPAGHISDV